MAARASPSGGMTTLYTVQAELRRLAMVILKEPTEPLPTCDGADVDSDIFGGID